MTAMLFGSAMLDKVKIAELLGTEGMAAVIWL
jgi:hypothetical protein